MSRSLKITSAVAATLATVLVARRLLRRRTPETVVVDGTTLDDAR